MKLHGIKPLTESQKRMCLLMAESVKVASDGTFKLEAGAAFGIGKNRYGSDDLFDYEGRTIMVRFHPARLHDPVYCYTASGKEICSAECMQAAGFGDTDAAREQLRHRRARIKAAKKALAAEKRMEAIEKLALFPDQISEEDEIRSDILRPAFGIGSGIKMAVNSDIIPDEEDVEEIGGRHIDFLKAVEMMGRNREERI
jgi:hypothetical protein